MADNPAQVVTLPQLLRPRHVPDVPQDVDFLLDHLNDPNYDLRNRSKSAIASSDTFDKKGDGFSGKPDFSTTKSMDFDTESQAESTRFSTTSRMSDFTDFDEYVDPRKVAEMLWTHNPAANLLIPKCALRCLVSMILPCQSTHSACGFWACFTPFSSRVSISFSACDVRSFLSFAAALAHLLC
jgi:hypothetical protein